MKQYYVYCHLRNDTNEPFYVGKGSKYRAYEKTSRNKHWHAIVNKHGYSVKFLATNLNEVEAFYLENFHIKGLGRKDFGGYLVNQTDGGEGQSGALVTKAKKQLMSKIITGKILKPVNKDKLIEDYKLLNNLKKVAKMHNICIGTALKYIPKELRQQSRSKNGQLNSIRLLGKKPWNYGRKANPSN